MNKVLSEDTQVVLLLCGRFGGEGPQLQPLSNGEYNRFVRWLVERNLRPSMLLDADGAWLGEQFSDSGFEATRIGRLLQRGSALALAVEQWTNVGLWVVGRGDAEYPERLRQRLKSAAPPLLYGAGAVELLQQGGIAVVGSRDASDAVLAATQTAGARGAELKHTVVSGGARGVDSAAMLGALEAGGAAVGVLADSLLRMATAGKFRDFVQEGRLALVSMNHPRAIFNVGAAMERNKLIYALADVALVMSADANKGGTWHGAVENLEQKWVPLLVWNGEQALEGNRLLVKRGGIPIAEEDVATAAAFQKRLAEAPCAQTGGEQMDLLG